MIRCGNILTDYAASVDLLLQVRKDDIHAGDWVLVKTCNSMYTLRMLGDNEYLVSGGWFDRKGMSPFRTKIIGCTWGGSAIKMDTVAACGLCLEFGNRVTTSPIQTIVLMPYWCAN